MIKASHKGLDLTLVVQYTPTWTQKVPGYFCGLVSQGKLQAFFEPHVLMYISCNQYLDFPDLILSLIENGERVNGYPFDGYWQDLGRPDD